jgi:hypothetical protein
MAAMPSSSLLSPRAVAVLAAVHVYTHTAGGDLAAAAAWPGVLLRLISVCVPMLAPQSADN